MGRHNREGRGEDQHGFEYEISYPPDWLSHVKVTRQLESGRQSTMTLFRNPEAPKQPPGKNVRTRIRSAEQDLDFEVVLHDPDDRVVRVQVEAVPAGAERGTGFVSFTLSGHED